MAITILSLGFLSRSDVELACGENMILRTQMDYLAESGLEHARGLIRNDSNYLDLDYWEVPEQQLATGSDDYYDVNVVKLPGEYNYKITSHAYRKKDGEEIAQSNLKAELRLDPCIAFWVEKSIFIAPSVTINGDVYCNGTLANSGTINGDVFADGLAGGGSITGRRKAKGDLLSLLDWPEIKPENYLLYDYTITDSNLNSGNYTGVVYCPNDVKLLGDVNITGMLIVDANLTITGSRNVITAGENLPAMLVTGKLTIATGGQLSVNGLAIVNVRVANSGNINITGGLFLKDLLVGTGNTTITAAPSKTAIITWPSLGNPVRWSPAGGAFFKSIKRP
jgi:cytoskeletal protein CcmA (bactofilin family)